MRSDMDHTVLPANYTMPAFTPQPQSITHPSTNRDQRRLTSLIETNDATTTPHHHLTRSSVAASAYHHHHHHHEVYFSQNVSRNNNKLALYRTGGRLLLTANFKVT